MKSCDIPNLITVLRILLVVPILWLLLQECYAEALLVFIVAGVSDAVDGFLAKQYGWASKLGGILDPLADKLLLTGTMVVLCWQGELPVWLVVLVIWRDVVIVCGALSYHYWVERFEAKPLLISKINTLMQLTLVVVVIFARGVIPLPEVLLKILIGVTGLTTLISGLAYVWEWGQRARRKWRQPNVL